eukprot:TRINITY_DN13924_c0_g1_i1.p1 TRINITY_DN13924_c0_g1~~TRINITY_DN13924_c0_g1_i1.p1  ORF type:complete len:334 (+),score=-24.28 TRINITY_DN13924_c0_g1_i1:261-1262(+)
MAQPFVQQPGLVAPKRGSQTRRRRLHGPGVFRASTPALLSAAILACLLFAPLPSKAVDCPSGQRLCTSVNSCVRIGAMCPTTPAVPVSTTGSDTCHSDQMQCADGSGCVATSAVCDGRPDCRDASDEDSAVCASFNACASQGMAQCSDNTTCVEPWKLCDGVSDCPSGSDESAAACADLDCQRGSIHCPSSPDVCTRGAFCNGVNDCPVTNATLAYTEDEDPAVCALYVHEKKIFRPRNPGGSGSGGSTLSFGGDGDLPTGQSNSGAPSSGGSKGKDAGKGKGKGKGKGSGSGKGKGGSVAGKTKAQADKAKQAAAEELKRRSQKTGVNYIKH